MKEGINHTDGRTRTCGLIGNPVEHTMSPVIHNSLAAMMGHNLVYVPFHVKSGLKEAVEGAYALNILGMNVTIPYKSEVMKYLAGVDEKAKQIGAVNTLVRTGSGYMGYNTDMPGLYRAMRDEGIELQDADVLILGAGGVARAVALLAAEKGAKRLCILNRTIEKAERILTEIKELLLQTPGKEVLELSALPLHAYEELEGEEWIGIQATSVGMFPNDDDVIIGEKEFYKKLKAGYDLIFNPYETKFMKLTRAAGKPAYNGLKMLLYQGIIAYELWNDTQVTAEQAKRVFEAMQRAIKER